MTAPLVKLVAFDLDDTLAPSKQRVADSMAQLLNGLLGICEVCIISGGRFEQFEQQVLDALDCERPSIRRLHLMPTCGTRYYNWRSSGWSLVYAEDLDPREKRAALEALRIVSTELGYWPESPFGDVIEDRGSQITFSALGQEAPVALKKAWDPTATKKEEIRSRVQELLPNLEVRSGGSTSVDITRAGIDKCYGLGRLMKRLSLTSDDVIFVGDRLDPGGNDYPVKSLGIRCLAVECPDETTRWIRSVLSNGLDAASAELASAASEPLSA